MKFHFLSSDSFEAKEAEKNLISMYGQNTAENSDYIVPIGGDGLLLRTLHRLNNLNKPFFGINFGSIGFLMNNIKNKDLNETVTNAKKSFFKPLKMKATSVDNQVFEAYAYNEVSLMRQTHLASKIKIKFNVLDNKNRSSSVTADNIEFRNIDKVNIESSNENKCTVLFDRKHSIEDKILNEQFNF